MVEVKDRDVVVADASGPSTVMMVVLSLVIVAVLGFAAYYFSQGDLKNNPTTIIERTNQVPVPVPSLPTPGPAPAPSDAQ